jgi:hypothetical protein
VEEKKTMTLRCVRLEEFMGSATAAAPFAVERAPPAAPSTRSAKRVPVQADAAHVAVAGLGTSVEPVTPGVVQALADLTTIVSFVHKALFGDEVAAQVHTLALIRQ